MEFLFIEVSPMAGTERPVEPGATVGREGCDHVLVDPEVSRRHAAFRRVDSQLAVEDLGSTNGTFVNDRRITGISVLSEGDRVRFGNTVWRLERGAGAGRAQETAAAAPATAGGDGERGDRVPTGVRRAIPTQPVPGAVPHFEVARPPRRILGGSAARRFEATVVSYLVVLATAAGVIAFFIER
jgi:FHA domain